MTVEPPLLAQDVGQQEGTAGRAGSVNPVIGSHDRFHPGFLDQRLKGWQVGFKQVFLGGIHVELMTKSLRAGVDGKVLGTGRGFEEKGVFTLQTFHKGNPHAG